ncbi:MAG: Redoxin domain protein [Lacunisphaera sp.]|nr:Redoxin domain protein [Lacunisphaera sp.]
MQFPRNFRAGVLLGFVLLAAAQAETRVGDRFPPLVPAPAGRVVVVDFWASWCAPCKASFPAYARLQADYAPRGLVIVGVSVDENDAAFAAFVKKFAPPFATVRDRDRQLVTRVKVPAMPTCYVLGRDGRVRFVHEGFHGAATERTLRQEIDSLLAENPPET